MNMRTSSSLFCSVNTAAFRTVLAHDRRGLLYRHRWEIMTMRRLRQDPLPAMFRAEVIGRIRTSGDIKSMISR
jgi:hypothetical protein